MHIAGGSLSTNKNVPVLKQGRKIRGTTLLHISFTGICLIDFAAKMPEKPQRYNGRARCAYCRFNTLLTEWTSSDSRLLPCTTRQLSAALVQTTLSAQTHLPYKNVGLIIAPYFPPVKNFCTPVKNFFRRHLFWDSFISHSSPSKRRGHQKSSSFPRPVVPEFPVMHFLIFQKQNIIISEVNQH